MIKAVLVDDEILVMNLLDKIIGDRNDIEVIAKYTDPEEALQEIPKLQPDVLFLDVDMPELNGIELGTRLLESVEMEDMAIVYVTAYEQYAIHAFKLNAIHYILKPADSISVDEVMKRIDQKRVNMQPKGVAVSEIHLFGQLHLSVNGNEVDFLTAKIEELLALLIINRKKGISKWRIIDTLWEEASIEKSQQNLYTMIFRLKKKLKDSGIKVDIIYKNGIYTMNVMDVYCDLIVFDQFMEQGLPVNEKNIAKFEEVLAIYNGDLLQEKDFTWCVNDREGYYQQFSDLVVSVAAYYKKKDQQDCLRKLFHRVKPFLMNEDYERLSH